VVGVDGWLLGVVTAGMAPPGSLLDVIQQVTLMGLFRAIGIGFLFKFDAIVRRCWVDRLRSAAGAEKSKNM